MSIAVSIGSFLRAVGRDSVRRVISDRFEVFRGCGWSRATVADSVRGLRVEDDAVDRRGFSCEITAVLLVAGDCVSCGGCIAVAASGGEGSVLTIEVV